LPEVLHVVRADLSACSAIRPAVAFRQFSQQFRHERPYLLRLHSSRGHTIKTPAGTYRANCRARRRSAADRCRLQSARWLPGTGRDRNSALRDLHVPCHHPPVHLLVLGGTWYLGRVLVEDALRRGHDVMTFNRGRSGVDVPGAEVVRGNREQSADLEHLTSGRSWDAVIDTSGFVPAIVRRSAQALTNHADRYAFLSTVSVYERWPQEPVTETSPVRRGRVGEEAGPDAESAAGYGRLKHGCELAVAESFPNGALIARPGVILGRYENVGRLPWWLTRIARGGVVLAPAPADRPIQPIDVRDVAGFILDRLEVGDADLYNLAGPRGHATFSSFLSNCIQATGSDAELVWVDPDFLLARGVGQWTELPLWRTYSGTWAIDVGKAEAAGLRCRSLTATVRDTWAWLQSGGRPVGGEEGRWDEHGLDPDREQQLLAEWRSSRSA
jgi:2'-hydroxyisoflavone reductase